MSTHHAVLLSVASPLSYMRGEWLDIPQADQYRLAQCGIDDVRRLISDAYRKPDGEAQIRTLLVATEFITEEAQQALLKIVEEPPQSTRFIFVIPQGYGFLPTLESRFDRMIGEEDTRGVEVFSAFVAASYSARLALIEQAAKDKNHAWQADIKQGLLHHLGVYAHEYSLPELREFEMIARLLLTRGASNKFLLEHLALTLPA